MNLHNKLQASEKWDKLLNKLIDEGEVIGYNGCTIDFKLQTGTEMRGFLIKKEVPVFKIYNVWIYSKRHHYAKLWRVDKDILPDSDQRSPFKSTMERLYQVEKSLVSEKWYEI